MDGWMDGRWSGKRSVRDFRESFQGTCNGRTSCIIDAPSDLYLRGYCLFHSILIGPCQWVAKITYQPVNPLKQQDINDIKRRIPHRGTSSQSEGRRENCSTPPQCKAAYGPRRLGSAGSLSTRLHCRGPSVLKVQQTACHRRPCWPNNGFFNADTRWRWNFERTHFNLVGKH